jgi:hypothetical protein
MMTKVYVGEPSDLLLVLYGLVQMVVSFFMADLMKIIMLLT